MGNVPLLFLDTSVLIASVLSEKGASRAIFNLARARYFSLVITEEIAREAKYTIESKFGPKELADLYACLVSFKSSIKPPPSSLDCEEWDGLIIDPKDCHVVAGAKKYHATVLVTLDKKHFFTDKLIGTVKPFSIQTPAMVLTEFRNTFLDNST